MKPLQVDENILQVFLQIVFIWDHKWPRPCFSSKRVEFSFEAGGTFGTVGLLWIIENALLIDAMLVMVLTKGLRLVHSLDTHSCWLGQTWRQKNLRNSKEIPLVDFCLFQVCTKLVLYWFLRISALAFQLLWRCPFFPLKSRKFFVSSSMCKVWGASCKMKFYTETSGALQNNEQSFLPKNLSERKLKCQMRCKKINSFLKAVEMAKRLRLVSIFEPQTWPQVPTISFLGRVGNSKRLKKT